jgi:hypothetical protein
MLMVDRETMRNKPIAGPFIAVILGSIVATSHARALQGYSTCHASGTTALDISGLDTTDARMVSAVTMPDAIEGCQRNGNLKGQALKRCAEKEMAEQGSNVVKVYANCRKGTIAVEYQPIPESTYYQGPGRTHTSRYKLPLTPMCGGDNFAARCRSRT